MPQFTATSEIEIPSQPRRWSPRIRLATERLAEFPRMGHVGRVPGTHEWVVRGLPYIIVYQTDAADIDEVLILGIFHAAQDRERD